MGRLAGLPPLPAAATLLLLLLRCAAAASLVLRGRLAKGNERPIIGKGRRGEAGWDTTRSWWRPLRGGYRPSQRDTAAEGCLAPWLRRPGGGNGSDNRQPTWKPCRFPCGKWKASRSAGLAKAAIDCVTLSVLCVKISVTCLGEVVVLNS